ncbi:hypothetical protein ACFOTA_07680 [Chitinophaga sp. GCM10012297]|uniref:Carboxypeptidase regulatory-like domain-containing protein n=1 Tax=Chitinophaga chungangae TaxID=2821488 RepID=A0ABS3YBN7_9BACT|nr:hypothetical protein [Chitinophaga chungangae]MBO9152082.1 hypothetical protein [Chitinophaga chungangae]
MKLFYLSLLIPFLFVTGCSKNKEVPAGLDIAVEGVVTSSRSGQPLQLVPVEVRGFKDGVSRNIATFSTDQTLTDKDGYFYIKFKADGESEFFVVNVDQSAYHVEQGTTVQLNPRQYNKVQLSAREKGIMQLHLEVAQNPYDTLYANAGWVNSPFYMIKGASVDTVLHYAYVPGANAGVTVIVRDWATWRLKAYRETIQNTSGDTLKYHVFIDNTADLPFN